jgi:hypothetical protein
MAYTQELQVERNNELLFISPEQRQADDVVTMIINTFRGEVDIPELIETVAGVVELSQAAKSIHVIADLREATIAGTTHMGELFSLPILQQFIYNPHIESINYISQNFTIEFWMGVFSHMNRNKVHSFRNREIAIQKIRNLQNIHPPLLASS